MGMWALIRHLVQATRGTPTPQSSSPAANCKMSVGSFVRRRGGRRDDGGGREMVSAEFGKWRISVRMAALSSSSPPPFGKTEPNKSICRRAMGGVQSVAVNVVIFCMESIHWSACLPDLLDNWPILACGSAKSKCDATRQEFWCRFVPWCRGFP